MKSSTAIHVKRGAVSIEWWVDRMMKNKKVVTIKERKGVPTPKKVIKGFGATCPDRLAIRVAHPLQRAPNKGSPGINQASVSREIPRTNVSTLSLHQACFVYINRSSFSEHDDNDGQTHRDLSRR